MWVEGDVTSTPVQSSTSKMAGRADHAVHVVRMAWAFSGEQNLVDTIDAQDIQLDYG